MTKFVTYLFGVVALIISCNAFTSSLHISNILDLLLNESADRLAFVAYNPDHQPFPNYPSVMLFDDDGDHVWDLTQGLEPFPTRVVPRNLKFVDNNLFFTVANDGLKADLYRTHLAATEYEFTRLTSNFDLTDYVDNKHEFTSANGKLYFIADNLREAGFVNQLWVADGIRNSVTGLTVSSAFSLISYKDELYFFIDDTDYSVVNPPSKTSLWKTDGTSDNTVKISNLDDIGFYLSKGEDYPYAAGELLYFPCRSTEYGTELCRTDGTAAGTVFVKNIDPTSSGEDSGSVDANSSNPEKFSSVNGKLIFIAGNAGNGKSVGLGWQL